MVGTLSSQKGVHAELTANQTITPSWRCLLLGTQREDRSFSSSVKCLVEPNLLSGLNWDSVESPLRLTGQLHSKISFNKLIHTHQKSKTKKFSLHKFKKISYQGHSMHQLSKNTGKKWQNNKSQMEETCIFKLTAN